jgi:hypothetical protein
VRPAVHVFCGLAVMLGVLIRPGTAAGAGGSLCPGLVDQAGPPRCYPAAQAEAAQRAMARTAVPVWPGTVVWNVARLHLRQLEVRQPGQPLEIQYLFGTLGKADRPVVDNDLGRHTPNYVIVGELHAPVSRHARQGDAQHDRGRRILLDLLRQLSVPAALAECDDQRATRDRTENWQRHLAGGGVRQVGASTAP